MGFSDEMKGMCETLAQSRSDRGKAMAELHSCSRSDRRERMATIKRIGGDVKRLFGDVHVLVQHFHGDRRKMGKQMHQALGEFIANTRKETEGILKESRTFLTGFRGEHKRMAEELHQMLERYAQRIHRDTGRFMKEFHSQFEAMCEKEGGERKTFCNRIRHQVGGLRREVGQMRKGIQEAQKGLHADFQKAQSYWKEFARGLHRTRAMPKAKASGLQTRIMAALKGSPEGMTMKELSYAMGMPEKPLNRALVGLRRKKEIRKSKNIYRAA